MQNELVFHAGEGMMRGLPQFRLFHIFIATFVIAITLVFPAIAFASLLIVLLFFAFTAASVIHRWVARTISTRTKSLETAFALAQLVFVLSAVGWIASSFWLIRHHIQNVATIDIGPYAIGLTLGGYYSAT